MCYYYTNTDLILPAHTITITIDTPGQPQDLSAVVLNSTAIELTWTEPHDNNAPITGYIVQYQQPLFLGGNEVNRTLPPEPEITVLVELHPGTTYVIIVKAFNNVGAGNPSAQATARTFEECKWEHYSSFVFSFYL